MGFLRRRILLVFCSVSALLILAIVVGYQEDQRHLSLAYRESTRRNAELLDKIIELRGSTLETLANDYSYWDEMVEYIREPKREWAEINLDQGMLTFGAHAAAVYNLSGGLVYSANTMGTPIKYMDFKPDEISRLFANEPFCHFFTSIPQGLLEIRGATVTSSNDAEHMLPAQGYWFVGKVWDAEYRDEFAGLLGAQVTLESFSEELEAEAESGVCRHVKFHRSLRDQDGKPIAILTIAKPFREAALQQSLARKALFIVLLFIAVALLALYTTLTRLVIKPTRLLSEAIEAASVERLTGLESEETEFGRLAILVRQFFQQRLDLELETQERLRVADALREQQELFRILYENAPVAIMIYDEDTGEIIDANPKTITSAGCSTLEELREHSLWEGSKQSLENIRARMKIALEEGPLNLEWLQRRKTGELFWVDVSLNKMVVNGAGRIITIAIDITDRKQAEEELKSLNDQLQEALLRAQRSAEEADAAKCQAEEKALVLDYQSNHDALTQLPNRSSLEKRMKELLDASREANSSFAVLFMDLDKFKLINDTLGHSVGDLLLVEVASRLRSCVRSADILARMGGDEFTAVLTESCSRSSIELVAARILDSISRPFTVRNNRFIMGISIGIATFPSDGTDVGDLMKHADAAMYKAKQAGRGTYAWYTGDVDTRNQMHLALEHDLLCAIEEQQLFVHYQPIISLQDFTLWGAEALLRWNHPEKGMIPPSIFIPLAEETGLINMIGDFVLRATCAQVKSWLNEGMPFGHAAINVSVAQIRRSDWIEGIESALADSEVDPGHLGIEVTETSLAREYDEIRGKLAKASELGVTIAMDDFGMGQSSLSRLRDFPIVHVKIDGSFIRDVAHSESDKSMLQSIIEMAHRQNMKVTAEWVETEAQLEILKASGCDYAQGFIISPPIPPDQFRSFALRQSLRCNQLAA